MNLFIVLEEVVEESFDFWAWLSQYLSAEVIASIISVITAITCVLKLASSVKALAKEKTLTTNEVCDKVMEKLSTTQKEETEKAINEIITPLQNQVSQITPVLNDFAKILALSQENTPESRLAILELLQKMGNVDTKTIENAKETINAQVEEDTAKIEEEKSELDSIVEENDTTGRV